jgi:hypothetical protein
MNHRNDTDRYEESDRDADHPGEALQYRPCSDQLGIGCVAGPEGGAKSSGELCGGDADHHQHRRDDHHRDDRIHDDKRSNPDAADPRRETKSPHHDHDHQYFHTRFYHEKKFDNGSMTGNRIVLARGNTVPWTDDDPSKRVPLPVRPVTTSILRETSSAPAVV